MKEDHVAVIAAAKAAAEAARNAGKGFIAPVVPAVEIGLFDPSSQAEYLPQQQELKQEPVAELAGLSMLSPTLHVAQLIPSGEADRHQQQAEAARMGGETEDAGALLGSQRLMREYEETAKLNRSGSSAALVEAGNHHHQGYG